MDFRVLGPLEIRVNGHDVVPTAPKPRQVLALLVLRRRTLVQTGELIDELWEQDPPTSAMTTLQTYVYKLRRALGEFGSESVLCTKPGGYLMDIPDELVDVHRFEADAAKGRALLESGDAAQAATVMRRALSAWRGPALVDVVPGALLTSYVARLEELRLRTLDLRIQADLRLSLHGELVSELKALAITRPLDERLHGSLMIALHRSGRRQEALEVYQTLRRRMIEELGLEPGQELHKLHQSLLSDTLAEPSAGATTEAPQRVAAERQARRPVVVAAPPAPRAVPASASPLPPPAQLPGDVADFTGRTEVLDRLDSMLASLGEPGEARTAMPLIVITGIPGVGKTALATHMAHRIRGQFTGGQLYADLRGSSGDPRNPVEVLRGFLRALGVPEEHVPDSLDELCKAFRSATAGRRLLVLLDDAVSLAQARSLLPAEPRCAVIVTSRRHLYELGGVWSIDLDELDQSESVEMLVHIIGRGRVERERQAARGLVDLVGRLPLALRCIGSRLAAVPSRSLGGMVEHLAGPGGPLEELRVGELDVRSAYDSSYRRLTRAEQSSFRLLSMLHPGDFTAETAAELLGWDVAKARRLLDQFVDDHLLRVQVVPGSDEVLSYSFPFLAHLYARDQLESTLTRARPSAVLPQAG